MVAVAVSEVPAYRIPKIGDTLEINLGSNPDLTLIDREPHWVQFWNVPIRNETERKEAEEIIKSKGMQFYSRPHFQREYRAVPNMLEGLRV